MDSKEEAINRITSIADILNSNNINYIIGASCSLLVHGLDIVPKDIDIVVDQNDLDRTRLLLKKFTYEVHTFPILVNEVCYININGVDVRVNKLDAEYKYYLRRKGESEKVDTRIKMIEDKLNNKEL